MPISNWRLYLGLVLPYIVGCFTTYWETKYHSPSETYLGGAVRGNTLCFLLTAPFLVFGLVLCVHWVRNRLHVTRSAPMIGIVLLLLVVQLLGVWAAMFGVYVHTTDTFP